jgi:hypothetical protein
VICEGTAMKPKPTISHELSSSQVLLRFVLRLALLSTFAIFGAHRILIKLTGVTSMETSNVRKGMPVSDSIPRS